MEFPKRAILLAGGPLNNKFVVDSGQAEIRVGVINKANSHPIEGVAVYEPNNARDVAFFLENRWACANEA